MIVTQALLKGRAKESSATTRTTKSTKSTSATTNKGGSRRPEKSRKWESFFSLHLFLCASHDVWLTACLFLSFNLSLCVSFLVFLCLLVCACVCVCLSLS